MNGAQISWFEVFVGSEKNREVIREEKMEKTKSQKEVNVELCIVE